MQDVPNPEVASRAVDAALLAIGQAREVAIHWSRERNFAETGVYEFQSGSVSGLYSPYTETVIGMYSSGSKKGVVLSAAAFASRVASATGVELSDTPAYQAAAESTTPFFDPEEYIPI
ncbi:hypothetical protein EON81_15280, partial [bacterium]